MHKKLSFLWFLLGLGSRLQVFFSLSMSEILVLTLAPFLFSNEILYMKRHGVMNFLLITLLLFCGCIISLIANHAVSFQIIRGVAITGILICAVIVGHHMLRRNPDGLKWYFIGAMLSGFVCIFIFQRSVEVTMAGGTDVESIMSGPLFWIQRLRAILVTPLMAFYLKMPFAYLVGVPIFMAIFSILSSASGRSAALSFIGAAVIVLIGGKKRKSMAKLGRHFMLLFICAVVGIFMVKYLYQWGALSGYLGEEARIKYEQQTKGGNGIISLLIGGRLDSFVALLAIADSPILGKGYWAPDTEGYYETFLSRYGSPEDFEQYLVRRAFFAKKGLYRERLISCHSHITSFWLWYGLPGLLFWLYVIYVIFRFLRYDAAVVPQWYYWLAAGVPGLMWHIFFSPFDSRIDLPLLVCGMLLARAVRLGQYRLPYEMIREIEVAESAK